MELCGRHNLSRAYGLIYLCCSFFRIFKRPAITFEESEKRKPRYACVIIIKFLLCFIQTLFKQLSVSTFVENTSIQLTNLQYTIKTILSKYSCIKKKKMFKTLFRVYVFNNSKGTVLKTPFL